MKKLVKVGQVYKYDFNDNDILTGKLRLKLSDNTEFLADYVTFVVEKNMVKEITTRGNLFNKDTQKKEKRKIHIMFREAVPFVEIKSGKISAGDLLQREGERVVI
jgi:hypothetical protein